MTDGGHFDEESLIQLAEDRVDQDSHPHLVECAECRSTFDQYRSLLASFADKSTWDGHPLDETPNPETIANLRSFADRMKREDTEAAPLVAELLAGPREEWMPRLMADEKYRTAGVVRRLIAAMPATAEESPKAYAEVANLALEISANLPSTLDLGGKEALFIAAYREKSYSLFLSGAIDEALTWAERARTRFQVPRVVEHDLGRVDLLCASLYSRLGNFSEAARACDDAERRFRVSNDVRKTIHALIAKADLLADSGRFEDALAVTERLLAEFDGSLDAHSRAAIKCNEGSYWRRLNEPVAALRCLHDARFIFEAIGAHASSARVELNIAALLQSQGDLASSASRLARLMTEFEDLGMYSSAALAALFLAENRAAESHFDEVERLCNYALAQAQVSPSAYRDRALTALGLLREASVQRRASRRLIHRVRRYVERLPEHPVARPSQASQVPLTLG